MSVPHVDPDDLTQESTLRRTRHQIARADVLEAAGLTHSIECPACEGGGVIPDPDDPTHTTECSNCGGFGVVPS